MYSNKRSFEILEFEFWLYEGVPESERTPEMYRCPLLDQETDDLPEKETSRISPEMKKLLDKLS